MTNSSENKTQGRANENENINSKINAKEMLKENQIFEPYIINNHAEMLNMTIDALDKKTKMNMEEAPKGNQTQISADMLKIAIDTLDKKSDNNNSNKK